MSELDLSDVDPATVESIVSALRAGDVVVVPTDTVYGLAADPTSSSAMAKLFALKERPEGVPVAVLVGSVDQARSLVVATPAFDDLSAQHWPGAITLVADGRLGNDLFLGEVTTVGVRLPDHDLLRACALEFGPIAATSANRHGSPTITDPAELEAAFGEDVSLIIDGGVLDGTASTVVDVTDDPPKVLRQGLVSFD